MADISCERKVALEDYGVNLDEVYFHGTAVGRVGKSDEADKEDLFNATDILEKTQCDRENNHWQVTYTVELGLSRFPRDQTF